MSHEVNPKVHDKADNNDKAGDLTEKQGLNLVDLNKGGDKTAQLRERFDQHEKEVEAARKRVEALSERMKLLKDCPEPEHYKTMQEWADWGAKKNAPAYKEVQKKICN